MPDAAFAPNKKDFLRDHQILILEIFHIFLWLKFSPSLILNPAKEGSVFKQSLKGLKKPTQQSELVF